MRVVCSNTQVPEKIHNVKWVAVWEAKIISSLSGVSIDVMVQLALIYCSCSPALRQKSVPPVGVEAEESN